MKAALGIIAGLLIVMGLFFFFDVDQTQEGSLPEVEVSGGELPEFDVEAGDVEVGSTERTVTLPTIDIESPEEERAEGE